MTSGPRHRSNLLRGPLVHQEPSPLNLSSLLLRFRKFIKLILRVLLRDRLRCALTLLPECTARCSLGLDRNHKSFPLS